MNPILKDIAVVYEGLGGDSLVCTRTVRRAMLTDVYKWGSVS